MWEFESPWGSLGDFGPCTAVPRLVPSLDRLCICAVLTVVVFDHAADVTEGDFWRNVEAPIVQHPDLIVLDRICPVVIHISD